MKGHEANLILDADKRTFWRSEADNQRSITLDLEAVRQLYGLQYTPPTDTADGLLARFKLVYSIDGKTWKKGDNIEFGNLINDPTRRTHVFKHPFKARFVRIDVQEAAAESPVATIAELDLF